MPSHFELCIKVNTLAHAPHTHAQPHAAQSSHAQAAATAYMESSNHREERMICKYFIVLGFLQGQGMDRNAREKKKLNN